MSFLVIQTCVPHYRLALFDALADELGPDFVVCAGDRFFEPSLRTVAEGRPWFRRCSNHFLANNELLWQTGIPWPKDPGSLVVFEGNPRVLSTWFLILRARLSGFRVGIWGHAMGRKPHAEKIGWARAAMFLLADDLACYGIHGAEHLRSRFPHKHIYLAGNSVLRRNEVSAVRAPIAARNHVLFLGRMTPAKKPGLLLDAIALLQSRGLPIGGHFLGDGPERASLQKSALDRGIKDIQFPGQVETLSGLSEYVAQSFCMASPGYAGLSLFHAQGLGLPFAFSPDEPNAPEIEIARPGLNSLCFHEDNAESLADVLARFHAEKAEWLARSDTFCMMIREHYTIETMAERFIRLFRGEPPAATDLNSSVSLRNPIQVRGHPKAPFRAAVVWEFFGPYHRARLAALREAAGDASVYGLQIADQNRTYLWTPPVVDQDSSEGVSTLFPGRMPDEVPVLAIFKAFRSFLRRERIDVALLPSYWPATSAALLFAAVASGVCMVMMNETHAGTARARGFPLLVKALVLKLFGAGLVGGRAQARYFQGLGMRKGDLFTGYDCVDNDFYRRTSEEARADAMRMRGEMRLPDKYILNIGRMVAKKNLQTLIQAYTLLVDRNAAADFHLVLVGSGECEQALRELCHEKNLQVYEHSDSASEKAPSSPGVHFLGFRQLRENAVIYGLASVFVLPSALEEWGLVVNEAMAAGLPVVVSERAGCSEDLLLPIPPSLQSKFESEFGENCARLKLRRNGFVFDPESAEELSQCLEILIAKPQLREFMAIESRKIVDEFSPRHFAEQALAAASHAMKGEGRKQKAEALKSEARKAKSGNK